MKVNIIFLLIFVISEIRSNSTWTWSYRKKISTEDAQKLQNKNQVTFSKIDIPHFNQLIFSWNSLRPKKGFYSFFIKPRIAFNKSWGKWYKMADWGNGIQQTYSEVINGDTSYFYVRLEMPINKLADGFKLKVVPNNGADLTNLRLLSVCTSDFSKFEIEKIKDLLQLPSVNIKRVPKKSQMILDHVDSKRMCSPTSTSMLVSFLLNKDINTLDFASQIYDKGLDTYGSWPFNTAVAFEYCPSHYFRVTRLNSFADIHKNLISGYPVVVSVRGKMPGAPKEYQSNSGHVILIIGWDKNNKEVLVHDPAFPVDSKVKFRYDLCSFIRAWEKSHRLAYVIDRR